MAKGHKACVLYYNVTLSIFAIIYGYETIALMLLDMSNETQSRVLL